MRPTYGLSSTLAASALLLLIPAVQAAPVPLMIGDTTIQFPADADYVAVSRSEPRIFSVTQAALPPTIHLIEIFETSADLNRQRAGQSMRDPYYQVQVVREFEDRHVGSDEWQQALPELTAGMAKVDLDKEIHKQLPDSNGRMTAAAGQQVGMSLGTIGQPQIYRQTPASFAYTMSIPMQIHDGDQLVSTNMDVAGSMLIAHNKLLSINVYGERKGENTLASLRDRLDSAVDQTIALNPSEAGGFDWSKVGQKAMIGAVIGGLVALLARLFRRKD